MMLRYYGRLTDDQQFAGKSGTVIRVLNRARSVVERAVEVAVTVHEARRAGERLAVVASQILEEGFIEPGPQGARTPLHDVIPFEAPTPGVEGVRVRSRIHGPRRGVPLDVERQPDIQLNHGFSLRGGPARKASQRSNKYHSAPLVREKCFEPLTKDTT